MGQARHGCARTTEAVRRAIQDSQESVSTVQKWKEAPLFIAPRSALAAGHPKRGPNLQVRLRQAQAEGQPGHRYRLSGSPDRPFGGQMLPRSLCFSASAYRIHTVLTDNGMQFCYQPSRRNGPTARYFRHMFDIRCQKNGQVERMNRTLKDAAVNCYHYETHERLKAHLQLSLDADNHAKRLKTIKGLTP